MPSVVRSVAAILFAACALGSENATAQPAAGAVCNGFASPPVLADGESASHGAMLRSGEAVETWRTQREVKLAQCRAEIDALRAHLNAMEQAYNQAGAERNNVVTTWNGEVAEYDARRSRGRGASRSN